MATPSHIPLYSVAQIRALEESAYKQYALPPGELMKRAGAGAFDILRQRFPQARTLHIYCGKGNNGGDGYEVAKLASQHGLAVTLIGLCSVTDLKDPALTSAQAALGAGATFLPFEANSAEIDGLAPPDLIVDALLGIGLQDAPRGTTEEAIGLINHQSHIPVLSLDIPSGLQADTGALLGEGVHADLTVTFMGQKTGLWTGAARDVAGEILCHTLELPEELFHEVTPTAHALDWAYLQKHNFFKRHRTSHKGDFGHVLVIGGDYGMAGAVRMAGEAALRVGAGLVSVATHPEHVGVVTDQRPELMAHGIQTAHELEPLLQKATVVILGPGLGASDWSNTLFDKALTFDGPMVMDADGLNALANLPSRPTRTDWILTPHPGEASRLLGCATSDIQANRWEAATQITQHYGGVCVLKGAGSIIHIPEATHFVSPQGNPGMSSAGMGDVLSGVLGGLLAQGWALENAACVGTCLHGAAADEAARQGERGMIASDVLAKLRGLVNG